MKRSLHIYALVAAVSGCGFLKAELLNQRSTPSDSSAATLQTVDENGIETAKLKAANGGRFVGTADGVQGASINIPAGALAIDTTISMQPGQSLTAEDELSELGISSASMIQQAGEAVVFAADTEIDADAPLTLQIPAPNTSALQLAIDSRMVIIAKFRKASKTGATFVRIIDQFTSDGNVLSFETQYFGVYQAVMVANVELKTDEVPARSPIKTKITTKPIEGSWQGECVSHGSSYEKSRLNIYRDQFSFEVHMSDNSDCSTTAARFSLVGAFVLNESDGESNGIRPIDLTPRGAFMRVENPDMVKFLNQAEECGIDWVAGKSFDLSEQFGKEGCKFEDEKSKCETHYALATGKTIYQIYAIDNGQMRLGQDYIQIDNSQCIIYGNALENRPKDLEESKRAYQRIN